MFHIKIQHIKSVHINCEKKKLQGFCSCHTQKKIEKYFVSAFCRKLRLATVELEHLHCTPVYLIVAICELRITIKYKTLPNDYQSDKKHILLVDLLLCSLFRFFETKSIIYSNFFSTFRMLYIFIMANRKTISQITQL